MDVHKIELKNPISKEEINLMIQKIDDIPNHDFLLIDYGNHNFESLGVLKYCKEELLKIESTLSKFNKIAFLSIPPYRSEDFKNLKYFHSEKEAIEWLYT